MDAHIKFRCSVSLKEKLTQKSKKQGFVSFSEYLRVLLKKEIEK